VAETAVFLVAVFAVFYFTANNMKILIPNDGSESARRAMEYGLKMAKSHNSYEITILTVACSDFALARGVVFNPDELMSSCQAHFNMSLEKAKAMFENEGINVNTLLVNGDPAGVIIDLVNNQGYDKVVMGTRGLSGISGMLLGSVSSKVLHNVKVPVTLIH